MPGSGLMFGGKEPSHSFLRLKNHLGQVVGEIHGGALDQATGDFGQMKIKLSSLFSQLAKYVKVGLEKNLSNSLDPKMKAKIYEVASKIEIGAKKEENKLKVGSKFGLCISPSRADVTMELASKSEEKVMKVWKKALDRADKINHADIEYRPISLVDLAQNCHSVSMLLAKVVTGNVVTAESRVDQTFAMPGADTNIETSFASSSSRFYNTEATEEKNNLSELHDKVNFSIRKSMSPSF